MIAAHVPHSNLDATYESAITMYQKDCTHIWHILLNKYGSYIANRAQTANTPHRHIDLTFLHTYAKTNLSATNTLHVIPKYVSETNIPSKLDMSANYLMGTHGGCIYIHVPYIKSLAATMWPGVLYTDTTIATFWLHRLPLAIGPIQPNI